MVKLTWLMIPGLRRLLLVLRRQHDQRLLRELEAALPSTWRSAWGHWKVRLVDQARPPVDTRHRSLHKTFLLRYHDNVFWFQPEAGVWTSKWYSSSTYYGDKNVLRIRPHLQLLWKNRPQAPIQICQLKSATKLYALRCYPSFAHRSHGIVNVVG